MIAEGSSARFVLKEYATGTMVSNTEADIATAPGATGGQLLRRVSAQINLTANSTKSNEILPSKQVRSYRQTSRSVSGSLSGELSPGTYFIIFSAVLRGTPVAETVGASVLAPKTGFTRRKFALERYNEDVDKSRLYTELRWTGFRLTVPAEGNATVSFDLLGRNRKTLKDGAAPYFTAPADATATEVCNSLSGVVKRNGAAIGTITSFDATVTTNPEAPKVLGQPFTPDILLGTLNASGSVSFLLDDTDAASAAYEAEDEMSFEVTLTNAVTAGESVTFIFPRVKLGSADESVQGEGSQTVQCNWQALEATTGTVQSTIQIIDTAATA
jgi:hypothetical protein